MHRMPVPLICFGAALALGCVSAPTASNFSQAQLTAIETREIEAGMSETYSAAASALFDAGYTIAMSDRDAGLLTGRKGKDNSAARAWISPDIRDTDFTISIQLRPITASSTAARVKTSVNGEPIVKKDAIDAFWNLMQRQVLMKAPPADQSPFQTPPRQPTKG